MTGKSQREPTGLSPLVHHDLQSGTTRHHFIYYIYVLLHAIQAALLPFLDLKHNLPLSSLCRKFLGFFWLVGFFFFFCVCNIQAKELFSRWRRGFFEAVPCSSKVQRFEVASFSPAPTAAEWLRCGMGIFLPGVLSTKISSMQGAGTCSGFSPCI